MAFATEVVGGRTTADLKANLDTFFAANPTARVFSIHFIARDLIAQSNWQIAVAILYDLDGTDLTATPYLAQVVTGHSVDDLETNLQAVIATNPNLFYGGPYIDYANQTRRLEPWLGLLIVSNSLSGGGLNWYANGGGTQAAAVSSVYSLANEFAPIKNESLSANATLVTLTGSATATPGITPELTACQLPAATDDWIAWRIPSANVGSSNIRVTAEYTPSVLGTGDVVMSAMFVPMPAGYDYSALTNETVQQSTVSLAAIAAGTQVSTQWDFTPAQHGLSTGDEALLVIQRLGADGSDTEPGTIDILRSRVALIT